MNKIIVHEEMGSWNKEIHTILNTLAISQSIGDTPLQYIGPGTDLLKSECLIDELNEFNEKGRLALQVKLDQAKKICEAARASSGITLERLQRNMPKVPTEELKYIVNFMVDQDILEIEKNKLLTVYKFNKKSLMQ